MGWLIVINNIIIMEKQGVRDMGKFYDKLQSATDEDKAVNPLYKDEIKKTLHKVDSGADIDIENVSYAFNTDGLFNCYYTNSDDVRIPFIMLLECKRDVNFENSVEMSHVVLQAICYLYNMQESNRYHKAGYSCELPRLIVMGSKHNCGVLPLNSLQRFLTMSYIAGYKSASTAYQLPENKGILEMIREDENIRSYLTIYNTSDSKCIEELCRDMIRYAKMLDGGDMSEDFTSQNLSRAFDFFDMYVLDKKQASKMTAREKKDKFMSIVLDSKMVNEMKPMGGYDIGTKTIELIINGTDKLTVNFKPYQVFITKFSIRQYSKLEQKDLTAITDRLIEDADRRMKGDFYTPTVWVDEAHKLLDANLGSSWREDYMVWDCAWGTGNLTRDYNFSDLYCSTLEQGDLDIGARYNKNAVKFQYDFLNDDVEEFESVRSMIRIGQPQTAINILRETKLYNKAPGIIDGLLQGKKLLFLINPPYATTGNIDMKGNKDRGLGSTAINSIMDGVGACKQQLYAQFMYRITEIKAIFKNEIYLGLYCPTVIFSGEHFKWFREDGLKDCFIDGFFFQASQFADVSDDWAIAFSLWGKKGLGSNEFKLDAMEYKDCDMNVLIEKKRFYSVSKGADIRSIIDNEKFSDTFNTLTMSNALTVTDREYKHPKDALAYLFMDTPKVGYNTRFVTLINHKMKGNKIAIPVTKNNLEQIAAIYSARRLISGVYSNWINNADEYMRPDENNSEYKQWVSDSIVYSIFENANNQSSLRGIKFNNGQQDIHNEFFFMSIKEIEQLAGGLYNKEDINNAIEDDLEEHGNKERFVYEKLKTVKLSPDAQAVLDKAKELVHSSFKYRREFSVKHPEYHINTWDAGWYQIKGLLKEYDKQGLQEFNDLYKAFEDRMRPLVYELGFLFK